MTDWGSRKIKIIARQRMFEGCGYRHSYLSLPGEQCLDIALARESGVLDDQSMVTAVERDPGTFLKIKEWLVTNWRGKSRAICGELSNVLDFEPCDLAYLDYLGNLTAVDCLWIRNFFTAKLTPNARVGITISLATRANRFIPNVQKMLLSRFRDYFRAIYQLISDKTGCENDKVLKHMTTYFILLGRYMFADYLFDYDFTPYKEPNSPYTMFLIRMTDIVRNRQLNEQEVEIERAIGELVQKNHSNGIEMVVLNGALSLMKPNQETVMAKKSDKATKRHLAAVKAWETRRTNEKKQKRHLAAVKAWETRRAKGV